MWIMKLIWLRLFYQQTVNYMNTTQDHNILWKSPKKLPTLTPSELTGIYQELTGDEIAPPNESDNTERIMEHLLLNEEEGIIL